MTLSRRISKLFLEITTEPISKECTGGLCFVENGAGACQYDIHSRGNTRQFPACSPISVDSPCACGSRGYHCVCDPNGQTRILASLTRKEVTEKTLAAGLSAAVNQHDADAAKEESATAGRGTHVREVNISGCGSAFRFSLLALEGLLLLSQGKAEEEKVGLRHTWCCVRRDGKRVDRLC